MLESIGISFKVDDWVSRLVQLVSTVEKINLPDNDVGQNFNAIDIAYQRLTSRKGAAGCQKIIEQEHFWAHWKSAFLDFNNVCSVFKSILIPKALTW